MGYTKEPKIDVLDGGIQRFAMSGLSKERKDEAVNEEILLGKYTGEFFIKTKDGVVISTDILNRLKSSTDSTIRLAEASGMTGELYKIDFENLTLPAHVDYSVNIVENEPIELPKETTKILLNLDFDEYDIIGSDVKPVSTNANVDVNLIISKTDGTNVETHFSKTIQVINQSVLEINKEIPVLDITNISISSIVINKDSKVYNADYTERTIILHNLFVSINK